MVTCERLSSAAEAAAAAVAVPWVACGRGRCICPLSDWAAVVGSREQAFGLGSCAGVRLLAHTSGVGLVHCAGARSWLFVVAFGLCASVVEASDHLREGPRYPPTDVASTVSPSLDGILYHPAGGQHSRLVAISCVWVVTLCLPGENDIRTISTNHKHCCPYPC